MKDSGSIMNDILSQADILLPSQYFGTMGSSAQSGERRLMLAVLVDAINILRSWKSTGGARKRYYFAEAAQWLNAPGTTHPFSFDSVCDTLEIDSGQLRSRLQRLTVRSANSTRSPLGHLRLRELTRIQQMMPNRVHRPGRRLVSIKSISHSVSEQSIKS